MFFLIKRLEDKQVFIVESKDFRKDLTIVNDIVGSLEVDEYEVVEKSTRIFDLFKKDMVVTTTDEDIYVITEEVLKKYKEVKERIIKEEGEKAERQHSENTNRITSQVYQIVENNERIVKIWDKD